MKHPCYTLEFRFDGRWCHYGGRYDGLAAADAAIAALRTSCGLTLRPVTCTRYWIAPDKTTDAGRETS